jgi:UDP-N-acetylmuramyl pentapeptide synthase
MASPTIALTDSKAIWPHSIFLAAIGKFFYRLANRFIKALLKAGISSGLRLVIK